MFVPLVKESGGCQHYLCTQDLCARIRLVARRKKERDIVYNSAGATPHLRRTIVCDEVRTFEEEVYLEEPFCSTTVLPIEGPNRVSNLVKGVILESNLMEVTFIGVKYQNRWLRHRPLSP